MDAVTAGAALVVVQFCVSAVMAGTYYVMPGERCTGIWAAAAALTAGGILVTVLNGGAPRYPILLFGNYAIIIGLVLQWHGFRTFYRRPRGLAGWIAGAIFCVLYAGSLIAGAEVETRTRLMAFAVLTILILSAWELRRGQAKQRSFATVLTTGGAAFLVICYIVNVTASSLGFAEFSPQTRSSFAITLMYMVPIGGTLLLTTGSVLLLFERLLADKDHLATHDELTGIMNRRAIVAGAEREVAVARRTGRPLAVAYVDIDHFKQINDRFGHEAGDRVIVEVARIIAKTCRVTDLVGRYGGEEFCIILPGVGKEGANVFGERLMKAIRLHRFNHGEEVTCSAGIAWTVEHPDQTWPELIGTADQALYQAKAGGRNRFALAQ
jgi:diguanylate cyclase (GGDEF)-like protein